MNYHHFTIIQEDHFDSYELRNRYILLSIDTPFNNVNKAKPTLCFTRNNMNAVHKRLDNNLAQLIKTLHQKKLLMEG